MILLGPGDVVLAASATSGFAEGRTVLEQTPEGERAHYLQFAARLKADGFVERSPVEYVYREGAEVRGAVLTKLRFGDATFTLVQRWQEWRGTEG